jgi:hypothetical protein
LFTCQYRFFISKSIFFSNCSIGTYSPYSVIHQFLLILPCFPATKCITNNSREVKWLGDSIYRKKVVGWDWSQWYKRWLCITKCYKIFLMILDNKYVFLAMFYICYLINIKQCIIIFIRQIFDTIYIIIYICVWMSLSYRISHWAPEKSGTALPARYI